MSLLALIAATTVAGCRHVRPFGDFPRVRDGRTSAIFALRSSQCDGNLAALTLFELPQVRAGLILAGVALVDGDSAEPRLRAQMRAYDIVAPVLRLATATRDSLARLTGGMGPAIVVLESGRREAVVLPAPQTPTQLQQLEDSLVAIAWRASHAGSEGRP